MANEIRRGRIGRDRPINLLLDDGALLGAGQAMQREIEMAFRIERHLVVVHRGAQVLQRTGVQSLQVQIALGRRQADLVALPGSADAHHHRQRAAIVEEAGEVKLEATGFVRRTKAMQVFTNAAHSDGDIGRPARRGPDEGGLPFRDRGL